MPDSHFSANFSENFTPNFTENSAEKNSVSRGGEPAFSPLVKNIDICVHNSTLAQRSSYRYYLLSRFQKAIYSGKFESAGKVSAARCSRVGLPQWIENVDETGEVTHERLEKRRDIEVHTYDAEKGTDELKAGYVGLLRCASPLICPVCSAKIKAHRSKEIEQGGAAMLRRGYTFAFITFTAAHEYNSASLYDFIQRFNAASRDLKAGRQWQEFKARWKLQHSIRTVETTDDAFNVPAKARTGWHYHAHTLAFLERPPLFKAEAHEIENELSAMWLKALAGVGLQASREHGCRVDMPRTALDGKIDSGETLKKLANYIAKTAGYEMSGAAKTGKKGRRISVWELQAAALTTAPEHIPRYAEYVRAVRGIHFNQWSPGLKVFVGLKDITDEEIMRGEAETPLCIVAPEDMRAVAWQGGQRKLLNKAISDGLNGVLLGLYAANSGCDIETGEVLTDDFT